MSLCKRLVEEGGRAPRFVSRLTPISLFGKANEKSIGQMAEQVLPPHFGDVPEGGEGKKVCVGHPLVVTVAVRRDIDWTGAVQAPAQTKSDH